MSLSDVRSYFRAVLDNRDFSEWTDGFNAENIPDNIIDRAYHLGPVNASGVTLDHRCADQKASITIAVFFKGYRDPADALETSLTESNEIIRDALKPATRTSGDTLKNVFFDTLVQVELDGSNDNIVRVNMTFTCDLIMALMEGP